MVNVVVWVALGSAAYVFFALAFALGAYARIDYEERVWRGYRWRDSLPAMAEDIVRQAVTRRFHRFLSGEPVATFYLPLAVLLVALGVKQRLI
jgi:hypothetical protein